MLKATIVGRIIRSLTRPVTTVALKLVYRRPSLQIERFLSGDNEFVRKHKFGRRIALVEGG